MLLESNLYEKVKAAARNDEEAMDLLSRLDAQSKYLDECWEKGHLKIDKNGVLKGFHLREMSVQEAEELRKQVRAYNKLRRELLVKFPPDVPDASKETVDTCVQIAMEDSKEYEKTLDAAEEELRDMPEHSYGFTNAIARHFVGIQEKFRAFQESATKKELLQRTDALREEFRKGRESIVSSVHEADMKDRTFENAIFMLGKEADNYRDAFASKIPSEIKAMERIISEARIQESYLRARSMNEQGQDEPTYLQEISFQKKKIEDMEARISQLRLLSEQFKKNEEDVLARMREFENQRRIFREKNMLTVSYTLGKAYDVFSTSASNFAKSARSAGNWILKGFSKMSRQAMEFGQRKYDIASKDAHAWCGAMRVVAERYMEKGSIIRKPFQSLKSKITSVFHQKSDVERSIESGVKEWLESEERTPENLGRMILAGMERDGISDHDIRSFCEQFVKQPDEIVRETVVEVSEERKSLPVEAKEDEKIHPSVNETSKEEKEALEAEPAMEAEESYPATFQVHDVDGSYSIDMNQEISPETAVAAKSFFSRMEHLPLSARKKLAGFEATWERDRNVPSGQWDFNKLAKAMDVIQKYVASMKEPARTSDAR